MNKEIVSRTLGEAVAKACLFAREFPDLSVDIINSRWDSGVYRIPISWSEVEPKPFVEDIVCEHVLCKDIVRSVLTAIPGCRDDDMLLLFEVWRRQGVSFDVDSSDLDLLFSCESVTRSRRKLQNDEGVLLPTDVVVARRRNLNEDLLRDHYAKN